MFFKEIIVLKVLEEIFVSWDTVSSNRIINRFEVIYTHKSYRTR